jgi:predicted SAM-dependent methyltransferase
MAVIQQTPMLLNLGCGQRFHRAWHNLDLAPADLSVRAWDVARPLPFADGAFDAVYHSHLLEHLPRTSATAFLRECRRVLKPGGILRVVVPDLEGIARQYLLALKDAAEDAHAEDRHQWAVMELLDQTTRESAGGAMLPFLQEDRCELAWYRLGSDGSVIRKHHERILPEPTWRDRVKAWLFGSWRERMVRWLLGDEYRLLELGRFRRSGEIHHWMYDRISLSALLRDAEFVNIRCVAPDESAIEAWNEYQLDAGADGVVHKPDSLFVEAQRP